MLNQIIKRLYSSLIIPYNPKGFTDVRRSQHATNYLKEDWEMTDLSQFGNSFTKLLDSIDKPDFSQQVNNVCDPLLAEAFLQGKQQIEKEQLLMEKVIDETIQQEVICSEVYLISFLNTKISFFENEQKQFANLGQLYAAEFNDTQTQGMNLLLDVYIKSSKSLIIGGQEVFSVITEHNPNNYHLVRFLTYDRAKPAGLFKSLKAVFDRKLEQKILFGENPEWRIVDIDDYMRQKYPNIM